MRLQGRIHDWNDARGFGFVTPSGGGDKAFVHIKAWDKRNGRPQDGLLVSYQANRDKTGRLTATAITAVRANARPRTSASRPAAGSGGSQRWRIICGLFVLALVASAGVLQVLPWPLAVWLVLLSTLSLWRYAGDKRAARAARSRIPEADLHLLSLLGGWPGALVAQGWLRHKSAKASFQATFWVTVVANLIAMATLLIAWERLLARLGGS